MNEDDEKKKSVLNFMALEREIKYRRSQLHKAEKNGNEEDIKNKKLILEEVKKARDSLVGKS